MPEKVTSLNGLKVTSEYCSYNLCAYNKDYVKYWHLIYKNQHVNKMVSVIYLFAQVNEKVFIP